MNGKDMFQISGNIIEAVQRYIDVCEVTAKYLKGGISSELVMQEIVDIITRKGEE